jgi:hypothetical protein
MNEPPSLLTLHTIPSPHGLSWSSPRALFLTTLRNTLSVRRYPRAISHVAVELVHDGTRVLTGMTHVGTQARRWVLLEGWGMSAVLGAQVGRLEDAAALDTELTAHYELGRARFVEMRLPPATGARLIEYLEAYRARPSS